MSIDAKQSVMADGKLCEKDRASYCWDSSPYALAKLDWEIY